MTMTIRLARKSKSEIVGESGTSSKSFGTSGIGRFQGLDPGDFDRACSEVREVHGQYWKVMVSEKPTRGLVL
eukprot:CAMPEP_0206610048 /NCGR_PEP_ID=MMETSP0325_2-20121206/54261_1 /ASSEMBLY_ACC=CAM_ASM_000347 /TAXON_ID=2866 /ORGANISM="Crypthecodinium cohnii, Strain Seligo" /LENGTH=71 /DNA_ID=CAMNT_0054128673 /DNA_START=52 /DNA_END=267 /DNA_ORIENTATION=+